MISIGSVIAWLFAGLLAALLLSFVIGVFWVVIGSISAHKNIRKMEERRGELRNRIDKGLWGDEQASRLKHGSSEIRSGGGFTFGGSTNSSDLGGGCND